MDALEIKNLSVSFLMYDKGIKKKALKVISDLSISIKPGEIHAVIGSSGSGKSLLAHALLGILPKNAITTGEMNWFGEKLTPALQKKLRGEQMVLVPQSVNYLDPLMRVGKQICKDKTLALETLKRYELDESAAKKYPFELSGGMARRVLVSTAAATQANPRTLTRARGGHHVPLPCACGRGRGDTPHHARPRPCHALCRRDFRVLRRNHA